MRQSVMYLVSMFALLTIFSDFAFTMWSPGSFWYHVQKIRDDSFPSLHRIPSNSFLRGTVHQQIFVDAAVPRVLQLP